MPRQDSVCAKCRKPSSLKCGRCLKVTYCSKEHQKLDWKAHKLVCGVGFKISNDLEFGRRLTAVRRFEEGEIVLEEAPLVTGPLQNTPPVCLGCYEPLSTKDLVVCCSSCGWPLCSEACEKSPDHKPECEITQIYRKRKVSVADPKVDLPHPSYQCITVLRCMRLKSTDSSAWSLLSALESHQEERRSTPKYENDRLMIAEFIQRFFNFSDFSVEDIMKVVGIVEVNGHQLPFKEPGYVSVYDKASFLQHDCRANCTKSFSEDGKLVVRAACAIEAGEELTISYTEPLWGLETRRTHLLQTKYFLCKCLRCTDPTELGTHFNSVKCSSRECDGYVAPSSRDSGMDWRCLVCGTARDDLSRIVSEANRDADAADRKSAEGCKAVLMKYEKLFHPNHHLMVNLKLSLVQCYEEKLFSSSERDLEFLISACKSLIVLSATLVPAENRLRGILHFHLYAALNECGRRRSLTGKMDDRELRSNLRMYRDILQKAYSLLRFESKALPEGKIAAEAYSYICDLNTILEGSPILSFMKN